MQGTILDQTGERGPELDVGDDLHALSVPNELLEDNSTNNVNEDENGKDDQDDRTGAEATLHTGQAYLVIHLRL